MKTDPSLTLYNLGTCRIQLYVHDTGDILDRPALRDNVVSQAKERLHLRLQSRSLLSKCSSLFKPFQ